MCHCNISPVLYPYSGGNKRVRGVRGRRRFQRLAGGISNLATNSLFSLKQRTLVESSSTPSGLTHHEGFRDFLGRPPITNPTFMLNEL